MNNEKPTTDSTEILNRIDRFAYDADWTVEELRESLRADGIDPDLALTTIKSRLAPIYKFKESLTAGANTVGENKLAAATPVFPGIVAAGQRLGFGVKQLAETTGMSEVFILKLDRRLVSVEGRARSIAALIADKINSAVEPVREYILGQSLYPAEANFKADAQPEIPNKQSFDEAVNSDRLMSEDAKAFLLSLRDEA